MMSEGIPSIVLGGVVFVVVGVGNLVPDQPHRRDRTSAGGPRHNAWRCHASPRSSAHAQDRRLFAAVDGYRV
jgi:hypothetical protein